MHVAKVEFSCPAYVSKGNIDSGMFLRMTIFQFLLLHGSMPTYFGSFLLGRRSNELRVLRKMNVDLAG